MKPGMDPRRSGGRCENSWPTAVKDREAGGGGGCRNLEIRRGDQQCRTRLLRLLLLDETLLLTAKRPSEWQEGRVRYIYYYCTFSILLARARQSIISWLLDFVLDGS